MTWLEILIRPIVDWLLEIPRVLLGRKAEQFMNRNDERNRRKRRSRRRRRGLRTGNARRNKL
jgi:hypothetical protein